jgi:hypothetical protein
VIVVSVFLGLMRNPGFGHDSVYTVIKIALQALLKVECKGCIITVGLKIFVKRTWSETMANE